MIFFSYFQSELGQGHRVGIGATIELASLVQKVISPPTSDTKQVYQHSDWQERQPIRKRQTARARKQTGVKE